MLEKHTRRCVYLYNPAGIRTEAFNPGWVFFSSSTTSHVILNAVKNLLANECETLHLAPEKHILIRVGGRG
jgi:hypothetical protein